MKKLLLGILMLIGVSAVYAQQDPQLTHFFRKKLNYNPAYAGTNQGKICASLDYRSQWLGFGSTDKGLTPETYVGSVHTSLFNGSIGVGLNIMKDAQGFESTLTPTLAIAYHKLFTDESKLSFGVGVGIIQKTLDGAKLKAKDPNDNLIPNSSVAGNSIDFNFGAYYKKPNLSIFRDVYAGLSGMHLNQATVEYGNIKYNATMHYYLMMGGIYDLNGGMLTLEPNIFIKNAVKTSFDLNVMSTYNSKYMGGLTYRNIDAIAILAGMNFGSSSNNEEATSIMVSYDLTTSKLSQYSNGTFEISLRYCFGVKFTPKEPIIRPIYTPRFL